jgi:hypothetical protein
MCQCHFHFVNVMIRSNRAYHIAATAVSEFVYSASINVAVSMLHRIKANANLQCGFDIHGSKTETYDYNYVLHIS